MSDIDEVTGFTHRELNGPRIEYGKKPKPSYEELQAENAALRKICSETNYGRESVACMDSETSPNTHKERE